VTAFIEIMQELVGNIKKTSNALNNKKDVLDDIPLARPLIEDSLLTVYEDTVALEDHLIEICADKYKNEFRGYINEINGALETNLQIY
jgi:hypothetical protein